jgi:hypothetical protein
MNKLFFRLFSLIFIIFQFNACSNSFLTAAYTLKLPELPCAWEIIPGQLYWKIEWQDPDGVPMSLEICNGEKPDISLPGTYTSAVIAWPYWPELAIGSGVFKPAGALFPFDVQGTSLHLSYRGGVDAILYRELGIASSEYPPAKTSVPRFPWLFNWPRFRELYNDPGVNAQFRSDPWLVDFSSIAQKIWLSGFDKRRFVPYARQGKRIPVSAGTYIGTSPFMEPLVFNDTPVFPVRSPEIGSGNTGSFPIDTWVNIEGILRCNADTWVFTKWSHE